MSEEMSVSETVPSGAPVSEWKKSVPSVAPVSDHAGG